MEEQLRRAVLRQDLPTVQGILQQPPGGGFNVNAGNELDHTALHFAVRCGHLAILQEILQAEGVNLNARTGFGFSPLHWACLASSNARLQIFQALLEAGADPNATDDEGETPLFWAARHKHIHVVEALLDAGANPAVQNNDLETTLHAACFRRQLDIVKLLIQRQGSECLTVKNNCKETPLDRLAHNHYMYNTPGGVITSIRQHILQSYAGVLTQRDGLLCLHSVLQDAALTDVADNGNDEEFELSVGKLNTEHLQKLLEYIIAAEPGSVRVLNNDGLLPLQVASQLNYPASVLYFLLRPYPDMLVQAFLPSHPQGWLQSASEKVSLICQAAMTLACCNWWSRSD